jgi:hypothetical protein
MRISHPGANNIECPAAISIPFPSGAVILAPGVKILRPFQTSFEITLDVNGDEVYVVNLTSTDNPDDPIDAEFSLELSRIALDIIPKTVSEIDFESFRNLGMGEGHCFEKSELAMISVANFALMIIAAAIASTSTLTIDRAAEMGSDWLLATLKMDQGGLISTYVRIDEDISKLLATTSK